MQLYLHLLLMGMIFLVSYGTADNYNIFNRLFGLFAKLEKHVTQLFVGNCETVHENYPTKFIFYGSANDHGIQIKVGDTSSSAEILDPRKETVFIIHGFLSGCNGVFVRETKAAYFQTRPDVQVVTVCYDMAFPSSEKNHSASDIGIHRRVVSYLWAHAGSACVGELVSEFWKHLNENYGVPREKMIVVSFSLGTQVAGIAGNFLNGQLKKIIALDPAIRISTNCLKRESAEQVIVLHTSVGLGKVLPAGTVDFYANSGGRQPGCNEYTWLRGKICSHSRSYEIFLHALKHPGAFTATKCSGYKRYKNGLCLSNPKTYFPPNNSKERGVYYFETGNLTDLSTIG